jgi:hypothetical protein
MASASACAHCHETGHRHPTNSNPAQCVRGDCGPCESGAPCYQCPVHTNKELSSLGGMLEVELSALRAAPDIKALLTVGPPYPDNPQVQAKRYTERVLVLTSTAQLPLDVFNTKPYHNVDPLRPYPIPFSATPILFPEWKIVKHHVAHRFHVDVSGLKLYSHGDHTGQPISVSVYVARFHENLNIEVFFPCRAY